MTKETTPQLERALTLRDLVLFNLVAVIGIGWVATSAKAGPSSLTLWLLAAILFFIPQGLAVIQLSASYPAEGGIYAWTKKEFGEGHGFLCGWCYWINNMLFYPTLLLAGAVETGPDESAAAQSLGDDRVRFCRTRTLFYDGSGNSKRASQSAALHLH